MLLRCLTKPFIAWDSECWVLSVISNITLWRYAIIFFSSQCKRYSVKECAEYYQWLQASAYDLPPLWTNKLRLRTLGSGVLGKTTVDNALRCLHFTCCIPPHFDIPHTSCRIQSHPGYKHRCIQSGAQQLYVEKQAISSPPDHSKSVLFPLTGYHSMI